MPARTINPTSIRLLFALIAALGALLLGHYVYLGEFITTDENSYLFQAWLFANGQYRDEIPFAAMSHIFKHNMIILDQDAGWLSRYPPAHAVWLIPGVVLNFPRLMVALATFFTLWFITKAGERLGIPIAISALTLLLSPYFWLMQGSVLSHTSGIMATALMTWAFIAWMQENDSRYAALAGLAWAFLFLNRTYTATWIALPFGVYAIFLLARDRTFQRFLGTSLFAATASIGLILFLTYNYLVTNHALVSTFLYYDPTDGPGFGPRHVTAYTINHTIERGWNHMIANLSTLDLRLWGFPGSLVTSLLLVLVGWRKGISLLFLSCALMVWIAYMAFWFPGIKEVAPVYYYETLVFLCLGASLGITRIVYAQFWPAIVLRNIVLFTGLIATCTFGISTFYRSAMVIHDRSAFKLGFQQLIQDVPPDSIVLLSGVPKDILDESSWNRHGMQSDPLIMRDLWGITHVVHDLFQDRPIYKMSGHRATPAELIQRPSNDTIMLASTKMRRKTGDDLDEHRVFAKQAMHQRGWLARGHKQYLTAGRYEVRFYLQSTPTGSEPVGKVDVFDHSEKRSIAKRKLNQIGQSVSLEIELSELSIIEPRVFYEGKGELILGRIEIRSANP